MSTVAVPTGPEHYFFNEGETLPDEPRVSPSLHFDDGVTAKALVDAVVRITSNGREARDSTDTSFIDRPINFDVLLNGGEQGRLSVWEFDPSSAIDVDRSVGNIAITYYTPDDTPEYDNEWAKKLVTELGTTFNPQVS